MKGGMGGKARNENVRGSGPTWGKEGQGCKCWASAGHRNNCGAIRLGSNVAIEVEPLFKYGHGKAR